jgi:hypothetical protein
MVTKVMVDNNYLKRNADFLMSIALTKNYHSNFNQ